jgi:hypothetical protein
MKMSGTEGLVPMVQLFDFKHICSPRGDTTHEDLWAAYPRGCLRRVRGKVGVREGPSAAGTDSAIQAANLATNF